MLVQLYTARQLPDSARLKASLKLKTPFTLLCTHRFGEALTLSLNGRAVDRLHGELNAGQVWPLPCQKFLRRNV